MKNSIVEQISSGESKILANLFKELELIEKWGTGINRIKKLCIKKGLKEPLFREKNDFIDIEFPREMYTTQETAQENTRDKIITLLSNNSKITKQDIMKKLNKADGSIKQHLSNLKKDGIIKRVGSTKSGYWRVINESK